MWADQHRYLLQHGYLVRFQIAQAVPPIWARNPSPHTLLALAEARHGVAIVESTSERIITISRSFASRIGAGRCASRWPCCGTSAVRCPATPPPFARCGQSMCELYFPSRGKPDQWRGPLGNVHTATEHVTNAFVRIEPSEGSFGPLSTFDRLSTEARKSFVGGHLPGGVWARREQLGGHKYAPSTCNLVLCSTLPDTAAGAKD